MSGYREMSFFRNAPVRASQRSLLFAIFLFGISTDLSRAEVPSFDGETDRLPTQAEIVSELRLMAAGLKDPVAQVTFFEGIDHRIDWRRTSPQLDLILGDYIKSIGDLAYNSEHYIQAQESVARIYIAREDRENALKLLKSLEKLALAQMSIGDWQTCSGSSCSVRPVHWVLRDIARSYELMGDRKETLRLIDLLIDYLSEDYPDNKRSEIYGSEGVRVLIYLISLGEIPLAEKLNERLVKHFLIDKSPNEYVQQQLIKASVHLEFGKSPDKTDMLKRATAYFSEETFNINNSRVDGRTGLAYELSYTAPSRAIMILDEVRSDVEKSFGQKNWHDEHYWLTDGYVSAKAFTQARELVDLYERELQKQKKSRNEKARTLWTRSSDRPLSSYHLFSLQLAAKDLKAAEKSFIRLKSIYGTRQLFWDINNLIELNIRSGMLDRAEELVFELDEEIIQTASLEEKTAKSRWGPSQYVAGLYIQLSDAFLASENLSKRDKYLLRAWQISNDYPNEDSAIDTRIKVLNRVERMPLHVNSTGVSEFNTRLFGLDNLPSPREVCNKPLRNSMLEGHSDLEEGLTVSGCAAHLTAGRGSDVENRRHDPGWQL